MKKTILLLMGASASGKSTLEKQLLESDDVYRVVSTSTRDMRRGEVSGVNYHFISLREFNALEKDGQFIQTTSFANHFYGTTKGEYTTHHSIAVLSITPASAVSFVPVLQETFPEYDIKLVYFDISLDRLRDNMVARGDSEKEIALRMSHDDLAQQFAESEFDADLVLTDDDLTDTVASFTRTTLNI